MYIHNNKYSSYVFTVINIKHLYLMSCCLTSGEKHLICLCIDGMHWPQKRMSQRKLLLLLKSSDGTRKTCRQQFVLFAVRIFFRQHYRRFLHSLLLIRSFEYIANNIASLAIFYMLFSLPESVQQ